MSERRERKPIVGDPKNTTQGDCAGLNVARGDAKLCSLRNQARISLKNKLHIRAKRRVLARVAITTNLTVTQS